MRNRWSVLVVVLLLVAALLCPMVGHAFYNSEMILGDIKYHIKEIEFNTYSIQKDMYQLKDIETDIINIGVIIVIFLVSILCMLVAIYLKINKYLNSLLEKAGGTVAVTNKQLSSDDLTDRIIEIQEDDSLSLYQKEAKIKQISDGV